MAQPQRGSLVVLTACSDNRGVTVSEEVSRERLCLNILSGRQDKAKEKDNAEARLTLSSKVPPSYPGIYLYSPAFNIAGTEGLDDGCDDSFCSRQLVHPPSPSIPLPNLVHTRVPVNHVYALRYSLELLHTTPLREKRRAKEKGRKTAKTQRISIVRLL